MEGLLKRGGTSAVWMAARRGGEGWKSSGRSGCSRCSVGGGVRHVRHTRRSEPLASNDGTDDSSRADVADHTCPGQARPRGVTW
jgi:hypothetical protein